MTEHKTDEPQSTITDLMESAYIRRNGIYKTSVVKDFPPLEFMQERIAVGLLSWTLLDRKERWIKPSAVINTQFGIQTASEIARDYLDAKFPSRLRATGRQAERLRITRSAPLYCRPGIYRRHVYVDLKSAFWSIMCLAGWDVDYNPGHWIRPGTAPIDFPLPEHKVSRNCLVSACLNTPMKLWTGYKFKKQNNRNNHINYGLWCLIMDTLHCIAREAICCEAVYIHTDGFILPEYCYPELVDRISGYGLLALPKVDSFGDCYMLGMGNWKCGERKTKRYNKALGMGCVDTTYVIDNTRIRRKLLKFKTLRVRQGLYKGSLNVLH